MFQIKVLNRSVLRLKNNTDRYNGNSHSLCSFFRSFTNSTHVRCPNHLKLRRVTKRNVKRMKSCSHAHTITSIIDVVYDRRND